MRRLLVLLGLLLAVVLVPQRAGAAPDYRDFGFIFNRAKEDNAFNSLVLGEVLRFERDNDIKVRQRVVAGAEETETALRSLAERGVGNILMVGFMHAEVLSRVAPDFPEIRFTIVDGRVDAPNVRSILFREEEAGYLVGVAAGLTTRTGRLGFVGGLKIPPVQRFGCGFLQGARSVNPGVVMDARYIAVEDDGFRDRTAAARLAEELLAGGADILFAAAGTAGYGALEAAAVAGRIGIGVDANQNGLHPGRVLTSALKRVDVAVARTLEDHLDGGWTAGTTTLGLAEGGVGWARDEHNEALVAPIAEQVEAARQAVAEARVQVGDIASTPGCGP
ncbi:MAG TPA: BMP family ABC transporter substrate-binding protein [Azospirillaceae bacterium]|nr:BMP family ABC transporter substrate-binding protein [Azospirillaceae bacterium]